MRRRLVLAGAGLAAFLAGSLGLIAWLTSAPPSSGTASSGTAPAPDLPALPPLPPSGAQGRPPGGPVPDQVVPDAQPQPERRPMSTPGDRAQANRRIEAAARRGVRADLRTLEPRLIECARLDRQNPRPGKGGRTVLVVVVSVQDARGTVIDVLVRKRGPDDDPALHCARGALMGQSFPVSGVESGTEVEVPLAMPVAGDEPDRGAR